MISDPSALEPGPQPTATPSEFVFTLALTLVAILLLFVADTALARADRTATRLTAADEYRVGENLIRHNRLHDAIEHLRTAATLDRDRPVYTVALAQAMLAEGRSLDAEQMLIPLLERDATDGGANLAMARVLAKQSRVDEAKSYYHRAIYELWPGDAERSRAIARFELIDLLARTGARQELLAELLPIQDESPDDTVLRRRVANYFVLAGSPSRASDIYRDLLRKNSRDAEAYVGLGRAALALGNYPVARNDFLAAQRIAPEDSSIVKTIKLADSVIALDPTQRGLGLDEQVRRSRQLVQMTIKAAHKCLDIEAPSVGAALDSVARSLIAPAGMVSRSQAIDENISIAGALWRMREGKCTARPEDEALALVHERISQ
ncbi:MAG TPA: tetratricopeptide repeat protein [Gemmatimonadaceae bacterium]|nr:tetratricopeptide repeat protein [Gemmatimonadaceae bacterium]